jgi:hypothetical protein
MIKFTIYNRKRRKSQQNWRLEKIYKKYYCIAGDLMKPNKYVKLGGVEDPEGQQTSWRDWGSMLCHRA